MANFVYDKARESFLDAAIDWNTDVIKAVLVRNTAGAGAGGNAIYTPNSATDQFLSTIPNNAYCRVSTVTIASPTITAGVADAADFVFASVAAGDAIQLIVVYKDTGVEGTSRLICCIDTGTGLPVTPNGANITGQLDNGANKLFKL
jgi:hypothetical protein